MLKYNRALLKLSGEALAGKQGFGFDEDNVLRVAKQVKEIILHKVQLSVVIGGGNFWRGRNSKRIDRSKADQIGMLATVMNAIYVSEIFESQGISTVIQTPFIVGTAAELYSKDSALAHMKAGKVVFFAGGTGHPYFSTDTASVLRAIETDCDIALFAKNIDGVYDSDPKTNPKAKKYETLSCDEIINRRLKVIDLTAATMCLENKLPVTIFDLNQDHSVYDALDGKNIGTLVTI